MPFVAKPKLPCKVKDCPRTRRASTVDWCQPHLNRWKRTGDVQADVPIQPYRGGRVKGQTALAVRRPRWAVGWCTPCHRWVDNLFHEPAYPVGGVR
jgi:hypothetical protein